MKALIHPAPDFKITVGLPSERQFFAYCRCMLMESTFERRRLAGELFCGKLPGRPRSSQDQVGDRRV
jgi:hypothetical protein